MQIFTQRLIQCDIQIRSLRVWAQALGGRYMAASMQSTIATYLIVLCTFFAGACASFDVHAQSEASALSAISAMPVASVVVGASAVAGAVVMVPVLLSTAGTVLVVKTIEASAVGTVYLLERASDGARVSIEVVGRGVAGASVVIGTVATVSVIGAGTLLSAAGQVIAFIPNELGRALLHNERVSL